MSDDLNKLMHKINGYASDVEYAASDLQREVERLEVIINNYESQENDNKKLHAAIEDLFFMKTSASPETFEVAVKEFFLKTIDKRL